MTEKNKHGLSRDIPADVKRKVRQRCGFGCVICGNAIATYEHFNPPFAQAKKHDPDGMTLLCGSCQNEKTTGFGSKRIVSDASKNPFCLTRGHTAHRLKMENDYPVIEVGRTRWEKTITIFEVFGEPILQIEPPEKANTP